MPESKMLMGRVMAQSWGGDELPSGTPLVKSGPQVVGQRKYKINVDGMAVLHEVAHCIQQHIALPAVLVALGGVTFWLSR